MSPMQQPVFHLHLIFQLHHPHHQFPMFTNLLISLLYSNHLHPMNQEQVNPLKMQLLTISPTLSQHLRPMFNPHVHQQLQLLIVLYYKKISYHHYLVHLNLLVNYFQVMNNQQQQQQQHVTILFYQHHHC